MTRLHWSTLSTLATSPALTRWRATHPREDTSSLSLGRAIHCAVLEPERWRTAYAVQPPPPECRTRDGRVSDSPLATSEGKRWLAEWRASLALGCEILTAEDHALASTCAAQVRAHRHAAALLADGRAEVSLEWEIDGVPCGGRLDWISTCVVDLKTTRRESLRELAADCARYLYHGQLAWYHDGAVAAGAVPADSVPHIVAVQTCEPYDVAVLRVPARTLEIGRALARTLLATYRECHAADWWPGMAPEIVDLDLPHWAAGGAGGAPAEEW